MNIALIIAGGSGQRMNQDIPKQFLNVNDKPIIIYTLAAFQKHPDIGAIAVVCVDGWHDVLRAYAKQFGITKLKWIFHGGENGQSSIRNGIHGLAKECDKQDTVLIHDANRPMVSTEIISGCIATCRLHGSGIAAIPCAEAMLVTQNGRSSGATIHRDTLRRTQTPHAFPLEKLVWAHKTALEKGITNSIASCTLFIELGETVHFSPGSEKNIKLTTVDDIDIFKALLASQKSDWLK
jgi:2-C-methyl-D-erythritol 4-phosphate cytidylyltransferase